MRDASALHTIARLSARERLIIALAGATTMEPSADKVAALSDVVRTLDGLGVAYALVGGVAVGIRSGVPRATLDTDIAVPTTSDLVRVGEALTVAGFRATGRYAHSVNFRHRSGEPVQIVFDPAFDPMIERAEAFDFAGVRVRVVTTEDLIAMKARAAEDPARRRSKALQDRADIELLRGDVADPDEGW